MRAAPPIDCPLSDGRVERRLITALHAATGALLGGWSLASTGADIPPAAVAAWLAACAGVGGLLGMPLARRTLAARRLRLRWDGQRWSLLATPDGAGAQAVDQPLGELALALDLGPWQLLRLRCDGSAVRWAVARQAVAGAQWHGLQLALHAHGGRWRADLQPAQDAGPGGRSGPRTPAGGAGEQPGR